MTIEESEGRQERDYGCLAILNDRSVQMTMLFISSRITVRLEGAWVFKVFTLMAEVGQGDVLEATDRHYTGERYW